MHGPSITSGPALPCWTCHWYYGVTKGATAICLEPSCAPQRASPQLGCSCWTYEPGCEGMRDPRPNAEVSVTNELRREVFRLRRQPYPGDSPNCP